MILFMLLLFIGIILTVFTVFAISVGGAAFIVVFGDVIVCIVLIVMLLRFLMRKK